MRFHPASVNGKQLRQFGVSSKALAKTHVYAVPWMPIPAVTIPLPIVGCVTLIRQKLSGMTGDRDGALAGSAVMVPLVHQLCHAHQRLEWGVFLYVWRHLRARLFTNGVPFKHSQVERECYIAASLALEYYSSYEEQ